MIREVEQAIVDRIKAAFPRDAASVLPFPDVNRGFPVGAGVCYVLFAGLNFETSEGAARAPIVQSGTLDFDIRLWLRELRSHTGAYALIELIQSSLTGFRPGPIGPYSFGLPGFQMISAEAIERIEEANIWDWGCKFRIKIFHEVKI